MKLNAVKPMIRANPLVAGAAASVMVLSLIGIGTITGWIPSAMSQKSGDVPAAGRNAGGNGQRPGPCANCGTIEFIRTVELHGESSGLGAVTGGLTGGVLGNQMGRGNGNTAMTIIGIAGGAMAGNEIEKNMKKAVRYQVRVRMNDGTFRTTFQSFAPAFSVGEKVKVVNGQVVAAG